MTNISQTEIINVVVAEKSKITRVGLREVLNISNEINIIGEAENPRQALIIIEKIRPDIILAGMNFANNEFFETIKSKYAKTKIIILNTQNKSSDMIYALGSGANAYCNSSISAEMLLDVIKNVSKGVCWVDPCVSEEALKVFKKFKNNNLNIQTLDVKLTNREREVLEKIVEGKSNSEIAENLFVSVHTAKAHVCNVMQKLGVTDRVQAAVLALKSNLI